MRKVGYILAVPAACAALAGYASAHDGELQGPADLWHSWNFDPLIVSALLITAAVYIAGLRNLWTASGRGRGITVKQAAAYAVGWLSMAAALVSPLHPWGDVLFAAHMTQHEILMLVSAPLVVMGRPFIAAIWAVPERWRRGVGEVFRAATAKKIWLVLTHAAVAWAVHAAALWIWHIPALFQAALTSDVVHTLQHASFFLSALLFWWAISYGPRGYASYGVGVLYLFTTSLHSGMLGVFLTLTSRVWYPAYGDTTADWGLTPLEDQQLGGLIMWVPAGLVYIFAALMMFSKWLQESEKRVLHREAAGRAAL